jgi:phosphate transport system permease protein
MSADLMAPRTPAADDRPRHITARVSPGDRVFRAAMRASGIAVLAITALILTFLLDRGITAFRRAGFSFFTTQSFNPNQSKFGIASLLTNGLIIAAIALIIAIPVGVATGLYISEYAPRALRRPLTSMIDLMAAIPSIVFAIWGLYFLMGRMVGVEAWLSRHLGFIPAFRATGSSSVQSTFVDSPLVVGVVVSCLVIPIITSLCREIFSQAPQAEREGAYALGATRWGMVRTVVLPFGRSGIVGSSMLGMGRALGDAIVISFLITPIYTINSKIVQSGGNSIPYAILLFKDSGPQWVGALMAAGVVLFGLTLAINVLGAVVTGRSRSGLVTV